MPRRILLCCCLMLPVLGSGCASPVGNLAGAIGGFGTASEMKLLRTQYVAGALIAYAIYDPLAPTWKIDVVRLDDEQVRFDLQMKALATGGEGEARQIFMRNAHKVAAEGGFAGFEIVHYSEGIESSRPFARRFATAQVRFARSHTWPDW